MKKTIIVLFAFLLVVSFVGCSDENSESDTNSGSIEFISSSPSDGGYVISSSNIAITIIFSSPLAANNSYNATLIETNNNGSGAVIDISSVIPVISNNDKTLTITIPNSLNVETNYVFSLQASGIKNADDNSLESDITINFTAYAPPLILSLDVDTSSRFFTSSFLSFSGDPASDFGTTYKTNDDFLDDIYDANSGLITTTYPESDIQSIYIAYDTNFLYIGHDTTNAIVSRMGAFVIIIDNCLTNGSASNGITNMSAEGYNAAGLTGDLIFDNLGIGVTDGKGKISLVVRHWQAYSSSIAVFSFIQPPGSSIETVTSQCQFYKYSNESTDVTEIRIPWETIFGKSFSVQGATVTPPVEKIKIAFITDQTLGQDGGRDYFPNNASQYIESLEINTWFELKIRQ